MKEVSQIPVAHLPIGDLSPDPANPRRISDEELESLTRSIREFGLVEPVVVRREDLVVIGGHRRASETLGGPAVGLATSPRGVGGPFPGAGPAVESGVEPHQRFLGPGAARMAPGRVVGGAGRGPDTLWFQRGRTPETPEKLGCQRKEGKN